MKLDIVNFEQAKVLKELGFPQDIENYSIYYIYGQPVKFQNTYEGYPYTYNIGDVVCLSEEYANGSYEIGTTNDDNYVIAPLLESVSKWFRDNHNIYIVVLPLVSDITSSNFDKADLFEYRVVYKGSEYCTGPRNNYEEALSAGIDKAIELLKNNYE